MKILIKQATVVDPSSPFNGQAADILIDNGIITQVAPAITGTADQVIQLHGLHVSAGWVDVFANFADPGYEFKETLETGAAAAAAGGFTDVLLIPNTNPVIHNKAGVEYLVQKSKTLPITVHPIGAITRNTEGKELAEMYDMKIHGAVAFSNGNNSIDNIGTMSRALQYNKSFDGLIYSFCQQTDLSHGAYVTEGSVAVSLGLKGIPQMAEYLQVARDIELADYHQTRVHLSKISTERSVEIIRQAKSQGIQVTCDVAVMNLVLTDETIMDFDSNLKLSPPLRQANDVKALWEGLLDGTIDAICSDHHPQETEHKELEFEYASYGAISIQIALSLAIEGRNRFCPSMEDADLIEKFNIDAASVLKLELPVIAEGALASMTIINPNHQTILTKKNNHSKSDNTYYMNKPLPYSIEATIIGKNCLFNKR